MSGRRTFFLCLLAAAILAFIGGRVQAQDKPWQYQVKLNGQPIAVEKGTVVESEKTIMYRSDVTQTLPQTVTLTTILNIDGPTGRPLSYNLAAQLPGGPVKIDVTFDGPRAIYRVEQATGIQRGEMTLHDGFVVCENNVTMQYIGLIQAFYGAGGSRRLFYVFVPIMLREISVLIEDRGLEEIGTGGTAQAARHLTIHFDTTPTVEVWAEPETGVPVQVRIPSQQVEVDRIRETP